MTSPHAGTWHRSGKNIVIDSFAPSPSESEVLEYDSPPLVVRPAAPPRLSLADARKQLRAFLKDAKSLKANAKLEPNSATSPLTTAFQAALKKATVYASSYANALGRYTSPPVRTLEDARKEMQGFLEDVDLLREWVNPTEPAAQPFLDAYTAARGKARAAAAKYTPLVK
jgi:hypothetical protein